MKIYKTDESNIRNVAGFMPRIKPEWWDIEGAENQLKSGVG